MEFPAFSLSQPVCVLKPLPDTLRPRALTSWLLGQGFNDLPTRSCSEGVSAARWSAVCHSASCQSSARWSAVPHTYCGDLQAGTADLMREVAVWLGGQ